MNVKPNGRPIDILLIEDNASDVRLTRESLQDASIAGALHVAEDGDKALDILYRRIGAEVPRPDLILLDLNLPGTDGRSVLRTIKDDRDLARIPVVVLTGSEDENDIARSYECRANGYIAKPVECGGFVEVIRLIEDFWLTAARLP